MRKYTTWFYRCQRCKWTTWGLPVKCMNECGSSVFDELNVPQCLDMMRKSIEN